MKFFSIAPTLIERLEKQVSKEGAVKSTDSKVCYSRGCTYVNKDGKSKKLPSIEGKGYNSYSFIKFFE